MGVRVWRSPWIPERSAQRALCARTGLLEAGGVLPAAALGSLGDLKAQLVKKKKTYLILLRPATALDPQDTLKPADGAGTYTHLGTHYLAVQLYGCTRAGRVTCS